MSYAIIAAEYIASLYVLWILYLAVMNLKRAKDNGSISDVAYYLGIPLFIFGYLLDIAFNFLCFSIITFDFPYEGTITAHLNRLLKEGNPYQKRVSCWVCHKLLDAFDPSGKHCNDGD